MASARTRIRTRLTGVGWGFFAVSAAVGLAAARTQAAMLYMLFGAMMGTVIASMIMARQMLKPLRVRRHVGDRAWQHQTVHLGYYLRNTRRQGSSLAISVEELAPKGITSASGYCLHLPAGRTFRSGARLECSRRGPIVLERLRLTSTFPLGLARAQCEIRQDSRLLVWPARGRLRRQMLTRGAVQTSTAAPSLVSGGQDEFFGVREYRPDDNPRWIHWRKSAARTVPVLREMSRPVPEVLLVVLDSQLHPITGSPREELERLIRFAATVVDHALSKGYQVGLVTASGADVRVLAPSSGRGHRMAMLDALALLEPSKNAPLAELLARAQRCDLSKAQVLVMSLSARQAAVRGRHVTIIDSSTLGDIFEDIPVAEAANAT